MARIYDCADRTELLEGLRAARTALGRGDVVVMPTDTVYGIAADAFSHGGVAKLLEAKGRTRQSPPPVLVADLATLEALAEHVPDPIRSAIIAFSPGPLTVILPARQSLQWDLGETRGTVALRIPDNELARELLRDVGPLAVSSANRHGERASSNAAEAEAALGDRLEVILDGGAAGGEASTIVDATPLTRTPAEPARIVRQGALARERLAAVLCEWLAPAEDG
ncbi:threonylcarbamoyl-AMP synthase [Pseudoclavibacter alba]|uniref:L-threonylcarbamoyladenylate synthase n=1 Tax=Pseudoclavibacter albus TaxID=272241 RepID=A0ABT2HWV7_9MICO|nr:L-threonylcarbamoyladenylate synthase [Pseudoclavibacter alba]MBN6777755.1 threonylcarbamoyl-AMP synthase [Pseudoclavibacter alba]MCT2042801.1 L-threonylcarbamoyladenylate synthase [Pseudoclavibacter alba]